MVKAGVRYFILFGVGYSIIWSITHYGCDTTNWSSLEIFIGTVLVPITVGGMFASSYDFVNKKGGSNG